MRFRASVSEDVFNYVRQFGYALIAMLCNDIGTAA